MLFTSRPIAAMLLVLASGAASAFSTAAAAQSFDRFGASAAPAASGPLVYATPGSRFATASSAPAPIAATPPAAATPAPRPILRRRLNWAGKTDPASPTQPATVYTAPAQPAPRAIAAAPTPSDATPTQTPRAGLGPPIRSWTQRYAAAAPTPPARGAATTPGGARYYSLHSAYGLTPDPAPIPPQFFGPTADMTTSETSDPVRRASSTTAAASTTAAINAARLASEAQ